MRVKIGCELVYETASPTALILLVRPRQQDRNHHLLSEKRTVTPEIPVEEFVDVFGNHLWRLTAPVGKLRLTYDATAQVEPTADPMLSALGGTLVQDLPGEVLPFLLPSRHCQSDLLISEAWERFGAFPHGWQRVQAVCDWIHSNIIYSKGSHASTSGYDAYQARQGVCRDFAHIGVMLCRALSIPARYVCGYLPDIQVPIDPVPMDFHAWFEVFLDGEWRTFDARHNFPRIGRVLIGRGRDAVDVALATSYGTAQLDSMVVWADEVPETQPILTTEAAS